MPISKKCSRHSPNLPISLSNIQHKAGSTPSLPPPRGQSKSQSTSHRTFTTCSACAKSTMSQSDLTPAPELRTYNGNCHCGAFKFTFQLPEITHVGECNCSICLKKGYRWIFPGPKEINITKGEGTLKEYRFNTKKLAHQFCPTCGTSVLGLYEGYPPGINVSY